MSENRRPLPFLLKVPRVFLGMTRTDQVDAKYSPDQLVFRSVGKLVRIRRAVLGRVMLPVKGVDQRVYHDSVLQHPLARTPVFRLVEKIP